MSDSHISNRKLDHINAFRDDPEIERGNSGFDAIRLTHCALPEINFADIDTREDFLGKTLQFPLLISSMTGGDNPLLQKINQNLAQAAEKCGVAMAVGSQRIMFTHPNAHKSFELRQFAPNTVLLSNLGAVQLNLGFGLTQCQQAVDILQADGLYLHLNPLQEVIQPEGDTCFSGLSAKIATVTRNLSVPVLFKEVGTGLSVTDITRGKQAGVRYFDIAGRGGTSWSRIEHHRRHNQKDTLGLLFQDWGLSTVEALTLARTAHPDVYLIASGGIRNGIDMAKAILLGAKICGVAAPFLAPAMESAAAVEAEILRLKREYQTALFLLGCPDNARLRDNYNLLLTHSNDRGLLL